MPDISSDRIPKPAKATATPDQVTSDLKEATDTLTDAGGDLAETAKADIAEIKDAAAVQLADATEKAKGFAEEHKNVAARQIGSVSTALSKFADDLAADQQTAPVADYARALSSNARRVSDTLRGNSVQGLMGTAQDFGRRQPVAFLGLAALAGFAAGRFLMASAARGGSDVRSAEYDADASTAYGSTARASDIPEDESNLVNTSTGGAFK
jgi:hypothetical protein